MDPSRLGQYHPLILFFLLLLHLKKLISVLPTVRAPRTQPGAKITTEFGNGGELYAAVIL